MPGPGIPTNGRVLQWAREYAGLFDDTKAAGLLGIGAAELRALEKGDEQPSLALLRRMSAVYGQPDSVLLLPEPPATTDLPTDYRTVGGISAAPDVQTIRAIRDSQEFQRFISDLWHDDVELVPHSDLSRDTVNEDPETAAARERGSFGVTVDQQKAWPVDDTFSRWRMSVYSKGVVVVVKQMPWEDCRGFSLTGRDLVPITVVNSEDSERARSFTLFHEYAHLLLSEPGVCLNETNDTPRGRIEKWCNEFAASFLVPGDDLRDLAKRRYSVTDEHEWPLNQVRSLATTYRVSRPVIALRLQAIGLAPRDYYERHKGELNYSERMRRSHRDPTKPIKGIRRLPGWKEKAKIEEVGLPITLAVMDAWHNEITDATDVADALGLTLDELFDLEDRSVVERRKYAAS